METNSQAKAIEKLLKRHSPSRLSKKANLRDSKILFVSISNLTGNGYEINRHAYTVGPRGKISDCGVI